MTSDGDDGGDDDGDGDGDGGSRRCPPLSHLNCIDD